jgi:uncharacterized protein
MWKRFFAAAVFATTGVSLAQTVSYVEDTTQWRTRADASLRRDTGWLTLAGRWELKQGKNRIGAAKDNDIVFPAGVAPDYLGVVDVAGTAATVVLNEGIKMFTEINNTGEAFTKREMAAETAKMKWVHLDRLALTTFKHPAGKMILRIADQKNPVREQFAGRIWYDVKEPMNLDAQFVPAPAGKKQKIVNVLGEITDENVAGRVEFVLNGQKMALDALGDDKDKDLFIIFNDASADMNGKGTYPAGRFLLVKRPESGTKTKIDFNRAYNPPCAFSAFTSCPLPPLQNQLKVKVEAGEKYRGA